MLVSVHYDLVGQCLREREEIISLRSQNEEFWKFFVVMICFSYFFVPQYLSGSDNLAMASIILHLFALQSLMFLVRSACAT